MKGNDMRGIILAVIAGSLLLHCAALWGDDRVICNFDDMGKASAGENTKVAVVTEHTTVGKKALRADFTDIGWPGIYVDGFPADWSGVNYLAVDVYNPGTKTIELCGWVKDDPKANVGNRFNFVGLLAEPGQHTIRLGLACEYKGNGAPLNNKNILGLALGPRQNQGAVTLFFSNLRLETMEAYWRCAVPPGGMGFKFSPMPFPGMVTITSQSVFNAQTGVGFTSTDGLSSQASQWPDSLTGGFTMQSMGKECEFKVNLPNGEYLVWLSAGKLVRPVWLSNGRTYRQQNPHHFLLAVGGTTVVDQTLDDLQMAGTNYMGRFLLAPSPVRPERIWETYINVMYPGTTHSVTVTNGALSFKFANYFLSAIVIVPVAKKVEFEKAVQAIREKRIESFVSTVKTPHAHAEVPGAGDYAIWVPGEAKLSVELNTTAFRPEALGPTSVPIEESERKPAQLQAAGALGQHVIMNLAVTPNTDLGRCTLVLADLVGPGRIPAAVIQGFFQNHFYNGRDWGGSVLSPTLTLEMDKGITRPLWLRVAVPVDAKPGHYKATFTFKPGNGKPTDVPVDFEVYPFRLCDNLPVAWGFYGRLGPLPEWCSPETRKRILTDRLAWLRDLGLTSITVESPGVGKLNADGTVAMKFDPTLLEAAKAAGLACNPTQALFDDAFCVNICKGIARYLPGCHPGSEFKDPKYRGYCLDAAKQYRQFIDKLGIPVVVGAPDEPRETSINAWNRNFDYSVEYLNILAEAGLRNHTNPMADSSGKKDYSQLVDYTDVLSTHGWIHSAKLVHQTQARKKTLWLNNTGKDRYTWGFYNWRVGSSGRWEWHIHWTDEGDDVVGRHPGGYPNSEWFNPMTRRECLTQEAPFDLCQGGFAFDNRMIRVSQGITDYAYVYTLEQALKANYGGPQAKIAAEARAFLEEIKNAMPEFPKIKGMDSASHGAEVGEGSEDEARLHVGEWRMKIGAYLKQLGYKAPGDPPAVVVKDIAGERRGQLVEAIIRGTHLCQADLVRQNGKGDPAAYGEQGLSAADQTQLIKAYGTIIATPPEDVAKWIAGDDNACGGGKAIAELTTAKIDLANSLPVSVMTRFITRRMGNVPSSSIRAVASLFQIVLETTRDAATLHNVFSVYHAAGLPVYMGELAINYDTPQFVMLGNELAPQCCASPFGTSADAWQMACRKLQNWGEQCTGKVTADTYAREVLEKSLAKECVSVIQAMPAQKICVIGHEFTMSTYWSSPASFTDIAAELIHGLNPKVEFCAFQKEGLDAQAALQLFADKAVATKPDKVLLVLSAAQEIEPLDALIKKVTASGAKVYVFDSLRADDVDAIGNCSDDVAQAAAASGATIIEVRKLLKAHLLRNDFVSLDGVHMTPVYHKVMATEWVKFLCGQRGAKLGEVRDPAAEETVKSIPGTEIRKLDKVPVMKDADWVSAASGLTEIDVGSIEIGSGLRRIGARVFMGYTAKELYALVVNCEPDTDKIVTTLKDPAADHNKDVWGDDNDELFLCANPGAAPHSYYHIIVNTAGVVCSGKNKVENGKREDKDWESGLTVKTKVIPSSFDAPGAWVAEVVLPFDKVGGTPASGAQWNINIARTRVEITAKERLLNWADIPAGDSYHQPERFKPITFK